MERVMRVIPGVSVLAAFLVLPFGQILAGGWEDGIALDNGHDPANAVGLHQGPPAETNENPLFVETPGAAWAGNGAPAADCGPTTGSIDTADCPDACCHANWTFRADALLLWRNAPASRPIYAYVVPRTETLGSTALNANDLNSDVLVAPRLSLLRTNRDGHTFESSYFYAGNFYSERSLPFSPNAYATSPPGIFGNTWGPDLDTSLDTATAKLLGQLQSLEFNIRRSVVADTCQFLIGARWLQWDESLQMEDSYTYTEDTAVITGEDFYETRCFNNLWGGQIGLDTLLLGRPGATRVEGLVKAGAYYNAAGQASKIRYARGEDFYQARAGEPPACSFVGELGLTAVVPISCNCDFRCGYFGLWLTNLAQPTRQLSNQTINPVTSVSGLDTGGSVILQGLSLGLESRW